MILDAQTHLDKGTLITTAAGELMMRELLVRVVEGPDAGLERSVSRGTLLVGTGAAADLRLSDRHVSRHHAEISPAGRDILVRDLGSTNGTTIGAAQVDSARVPYGTELRFGNTRVMLLPADLRVPTPPGVERFGHLVGNHAAMRRSLAALASASRTIEPVLLEGASGTGKTTAAKCLHEASGRSGPLVTAPLQTLDDNRSLRELLQQAAGGSLVLERADQMPATMAREVAALAPHADVRLIATSRRDLRRLVEDGRLLRDAYFYLARVRVELPPFAGRLDDIPPTLAEIAFRHGLPPRPWHAATLGQEVLTAGIPGNGHDLVACVAREEMGRASEGLQHYVGKLEDYKEAKEAMVSSFQKEYLARLLARHGNDHVSAAKEAGIDRAYLVRLMRRHELIGAA